MMLDTVKLALRIGHNKLDDDIYENIDACLADLRRAGVSEEKLSYATNDALITQACKTYCRWQYDFLGKSEQYKNAYEALKIALTLTGEYTDGDSDA